MSFVIGLQCKECGRNYPKEPRHDAWAFVNVNLHPYYSEGAKTHGFEVAEQLRWRLPRHIVVASAGGMILPKLAKSFKELVKVVSSKTPVTRSTRPKPLGCAPIIGRKRRESLPSLLGEPKSPWLRS